MNIVKDDNQPPATTGLHNHAEERLRAQAAEVVPPRTEEATEQFVHELEVHQIELEMQNSELHEDRYEMQNSLEKYTDLYEFAPSGYFTLDRNGSISSMNLAAASLLRIERSLVIGRNFEQFVSEECRPTFTAFLESVFANRSTGSCEVVLLNNVSLPLIVQIGAVANASGEECRLTTINITGQREAEEQKHIQSSLDNPRAGSDAMSLELCVCSLRESLDASVMMLREKALEGGVDIHMDLATEIDERIVADQKKLQQIMSTLLSNAIKFTPAGGTVEVSAVRDGSLIRITVADTGMGIRGEDIPRLFQPSNQPESVSTMEYDESIGLGLALTRQLVELHGGRLWVESESGVGSRFSFTIPLRNCAGIT